MGSVYVTHTTTQRLLWRELADSNGPLQNHPPPPSLSPQLCTCTHTHTNLRHDEQLRHRHHEIRFCPHVARRRLELRLSSTCCGRGVESYQGMDENSNWNPRTNNTDWWWLTRLPVLLVAAAVGGGCATASGRCGQQQRERGRRRRVVIGDNDSKIQYTVCGCAKER